MILNKKTYKKIYYWLWVSMVIVKTHNGWYSLAYLRTLPTLVENDFSIKYINLRQLPLIHKFFFSFLIMSIGSWVFICIRAKIIHEWAHITLSLDKGIWHGMLWTLSRINWDWIFSYTYMLKVTLNLWVSSIFNMSESETISHRLNFRLNI